MCYCKMISDKCLFDAVIVQENALCGNGTNLLRSRQCELCHFVRLHLYIRLGEVQHILVNVHEVVVLFLGIDTLIGERIAAFCAGDVDSGFLQNLTLYGIGSVLSGCNTPSTVR